MAIPLSTHVFPVVVPMVFLVGLGGSNVVRHEIVPPFLLSTLAVVGGSLFTHPASH